MGLNKEVEKEIKKDGFFKRNTKKSAGYIKDETYTYTNMKDVVFYKSFIMKIVSVLNPFNKVKVQGKEETFENAVKRLDLKDSDLFESFKYYNLTFWLGFVFFMISFIFGSYLLFVKGNIWAIGPTVACVAIGLSQIIIGSFRTFQINRRELCSFSTWYKSKKIFPSKFKNETQYKKEKRIEDKKSLQKLTK